MSISLVVGGERDNIIIIGCCSIDDAVDWVRAYFFFSFNIFHMMAYTDYGKWIDKELHDNRHLLLFIMNLFLLYSLHGRGKSGAIRIRPYRRVGLLKKWSGNFPRWYMAWMKHENEDELILISLLMLFLSNSA